MASKHIAGSRSLLLSSSPSELIEHSTTSFQKNPLYVLEEQQGYRTTLEWRMLQDKFTSFMFPPFLVSIAGFLMKPKSAHLGPYKARMNSDVVALSTAGPSNSRGILAVRFVPGSQLSLLWRTPWTYATFGRAYGSAAESRKREVRVFDGVDDDNDADAGEPSEFEDDDGVEDEQHIEDSDDEYVDDEEEEEDQEPQSEGPAKKKIQIKPPKSKFPDHQGRVLNEKITARTLRLVDDYGKGHKIVSRDEALTLAKGKKLDLVQVDGRANPPVCKIYDFNREEYRQEQILKDRKKKKGAMAHLGEVKELRFNSKTEPKDLKMKAEQAKEFMNRGYRVKFVAIFKGKSDDEKKRLEEEKMIDAVYPLLEEVAVIEQGPRVESRQAWVMLRHLKFASKKKPRKREAQIGATESVKHEDQVYSESDFNQGQEENIMHALNASSVSETLPMGRLQGYPSKLAAPPTQPFTFRSPYEAGHSGVQPPPMQDTVERFSSEVHSPPLHGFPQHSQFLQGVIGSQGSERPVSPPPGPLSSIPTLQRAPPPGPLSSIPTLQRAPPPGPLSSIPTLQRVGVQGTKSQISPPGISPLPASRLQAFEGAQTQKLQSSPLDGMLPAQSEQRPSHTPKVQTFSMPSQNLGILSKKQSPNDAPRPEKAIGSEVTQGVYPAVSRGRGISPPTHSLFSSTPPTSLRGPPSNLQGSLLNLSQSPPIPATHMRGPSNLQGPLPNVSPSTSVPSSHQGGSSNFESPLTDFFSSPPPPTLQRAPSSVQGFRPDSSPFVPAQNVQERYSPPLQGSEGLSPQGVPKYPPLPIQGFEGFPPRGVPRYHPPPIGQLRYPPQGYPPQQNQAPQGYPPQQNQAPQGYPPQQNQAPQGYPPQQNQGPQGYPPQHNQAPQGYPAQQNQAPQGYRPRGYPPQQNQAPQGYPPQQNQAPQGYPPQGYPPQQNQAPQGYPAQQYQAPQGYPPQQYQAPQGYPPQRGFPQTKLAQGAFCFQGNNPQNQASQGSLPPRGLPQTRPVVPSPPGFRPSWSTPPQSQEYSPLFESPSDKP